MKGERELRCYTFTIYQLSSIQQGIQAGHAAVELMLKYARRVDAEVFELNTVTEWAHYWKTMVCLNGGDLSELRDLIMFFSLTDNPFPWVPFYESDEALDGIPTSIAIVLPQSIFKTAEEIRNTRSDYGVGYDESFTPFEWALIKRLSNYGLAR